eukprot:m.306966 g.306966  ORF g.306966 m.306966 type:complete len:481 (+) comp19625_c2_seq18:203-1645(+)
MAAAPPHASVGLGVDAAPLLPRELTVRVESAGDLAQVITKAPEAVVAVPELTDDDDDDGADPMAQITPLSETAGWALVQRSRLPVTDTIKGFVQKAAHRLREEIPDFMRHLPQIKAKAARLDALLQDPVSFTVVVHDPPRTQRGGVLTGDGLGDQLSQVEVPAEGDGRVTLSYGRPGHRPLALPSLDLDGLAHFLQSDSCTKVMFITGAGISTNCGIPDYRSATGLYNSLQPELLTATEEQRTRIQREPQTLASIQLFRENPLPLLEAKREFVVGLAERRFPPGPAHGFCAALAQRGLVSRVLTQNIDGLHSLAGLPGDVLTEVHGSFRLPCTCCACGASMPFEQFAAKVATSIKQPGTDAVSAAGGIACPAGCGRGSVKPGVVLFGESVASDFSDVCERDVPQADVLIIAGTSLTVPPVAYLPAAVRDDCVRVVINGESVGEASGLVFDPVLGAQRDILLQGDIDATFEALAQKIGVDL